MARHPQQVTWARALLLLDTHAAPGAGAGGARLGKGSETQPNFAKFLETYVKDVRVCVGSKI